MKIIPNRHKFSSVSYFVTLFSGGPNPNQDKVDIRVNLMPTVCVSNKLENIHFFIIC